MAGHVPEYLIQGSSSSRKWDEMILGSLLHSDSLLSGVTHGDSVQHRRFLSLSCSSQRKGSYEPQVKSSTTRFPVGWEVAFCALKYFLKFKIQCTVFQTDIPLGFCLRSMIQESYFKVTSATLWMYHQKTILPAYRWLPAVNDSHMGLNSCEPLAFVSVMWNRHI